MASCTKFLYKKAGVKCPGRFLIPISFASDLPGHHPFLIGFAELFKVPSH